MEAIILAAGEGTRLRPLTDNIPKCMVCVGNKPIIDRQITTLQNQSINKITVIGGYKSEKIIKKYTNLIFNQEYDSSNMVYSLFKAYNILLNKQDNLIISYGDIIYDDFVVSKLIESKGDINVVVDLSWLGYWKQRMDTPLMDAETMIINEHNNILEVGKKPKSYDDINGQYIGLIKLSKVGKEIFCKIYEELGGDIGFRNMYLTTFLQHIIDKGYSVNAVKINRGWFEFDTVEDVKLYNKLSINNNELVI